MVWYDKRYDNNTVISTEFSSLAALGIVKMVKKVFKTGM